MPPYQSTVAPLDMPRSKPRYSLEMLSLSALFVTLVAAVFVFIPNGLIMPATLKTFILAGGALITLALYILARLARGNVIFPPFALVGALWFPVVAYVLSAAFSGKSFTNALWGSSFEPDTLGLILVAAILGTLTALILRRPDQYRSFLRVSAFSFMALVVLQLLVVIIGQFSPSTVLPSLSIVGSTSDLAFLLGLGAIGILFALRELELSERARRALILTGIGAVALLAIYNAPLVWTLVALVSLGLFVESVMQRGGKERDSDLDDVSVIDEEPLEVEDGKRSIVMPLALLAISLFFLIGGTLGGALANALHVNVLNVRPSWQSTFAVTQKVYVTSPVFGSGPGTFGSEWLKYRDASLNSTAFWNVDFSSGIGFIPTSLVTTGLIGALAWIGFVALLIVLGLRMLILRAPRDPFVRSVAMFSFLASLYLFAIAIFDLPSALVIVLAFAFAGLFASTMRFGAVGAQSGIIFSRSPRLGFVIVFSLTILLLGSVVAAYSLVGHYIATSELATAYAAYAAGNLDAADKAVQQAISFAPSAAAYQIQSAIAVTRLNQIAASTTMAPADAQKAFQTALSSGINAALTSTNLEPTNYQNWIALGNLYAQAVPLQVSGAYESAKTAYDKARALNPTNPQIPYVLAQLDIAHKDNKAAKDDLKAAIALKQDFTTAIFLLSQLEVQDGNVKDALAAALAAAYFTPNNPNILFQIGILYAVQNDLANAVLALSSAVAANAQFANARYILAAVYAKQGNYPKALEQIQAIADMSADNAKAVASQLAALQTGKNPFPANLLSAPAPVK
ncbi:MAG: tetratricopeptide repeat protein [Candidatus Gottesmanbacteria bacterium]|nr:tetratricopeptide repeat protein [Candidatus Gottesmanbacteria bacterium]